MPHQVHNLRLTTSYNPHDIRIIVKLRALLVSGSVRISPPMQVNERIGDMWLHMVTTDLLTIFLNENERVHRMWSRWDLLLSATSYHVFGDLWCTFVLLPTIITPTVNNILSTDSHKIKDHRVNYTTGRNLCNGRNLVELVAVKCTTPVMEYDV